MFAESEEVEEEVRAKRVVFKSLPVFWEKEFRNVKRYTIRVVDPADERFLILRKHQEMVDRGLASAVIIAIENSVTKQVFERSVCDVSEYNGMMGVAW